MPGKGLGLLTHFPKAMLAHGSTMRGQGVGFVRHFVKALLARGVPIRLGAAVHSLSVEGDRLTGVRMADGAVLAARKGVVLATGGYEWNAELMADFDPIPGLQRLS